MATRTPRAPGPLLAYVLHTYDWSESSLILDLFTREQGRLAVVAKGAKRPYSQLRPVLLPFQRIHVSLGRVPKPLEDEEAHAATSGARDVQTLRAAEWAGGSAMLTGSAMFSGFYLNELLMKLLARQDPHPSLFDAYALTLPALAADEATVQPALRAFELTLLRHLGVLPDLSVVTLTQQAVQGEGRYTLLPESGVAANRSADSPALPGAVLIHLQAALQHGSLEALQHACSAGLSPLRSLLRGLLHYHLGSDVLRTRQVMQGVQSLG